MLILKRISLIILRQNVYVPLLSLLMEQGVKMVNDCQMHGTNGMKDLLFTAQELKVANYYITYLHPE